MSLFDGGRSLWVESLWTFLDDSESSRWSQLWERGWCIVVLASVMVTLFQLTEVPHVHGFQAAVLETIIEVAFGAELMLRFLTCPDRKSFVKSPLNVVDFASVCPLVLRAVKGFVLPETVVAPTEINSDLARFGLLCCVPVLRLLKILRRNRVQLKLFETVLISTMETLQFLAFVGMLIIVTASSILYAVETRDNVETYGMAVWVTVVTMTTVGYGDVTAVSTAGRCVTIVLMVCSVLFMALPIGVLGNAFAAVWKERDLVLLIDRTRRQLDQWGYGTDTIPEVFMLFSSDGSGELSIADFELMLTEFRVHLSDERMLELFAIFDRDNSGSIDQREFLRVVFPQTWHKMVQDQRAAEEREKARKAEEERSRKDRRRKERASRRTSTPTPPVDSPMLLAAQLSWQIQNESTLEHASSPQPRPASKPTEEALASVNHISAGESPLQSAPCPPMPRQCSNGIEVLPGYLHSLPMSAELKKPMSRPRDVAAREPDGPRVLNF